jgi:hypothetical protein
MRGVFGKDHVGGAIWEAACGRRHVGGTMCEDPCGRRHVGGGMWEARLAAIMHNNQVKKGEAGKRLRSWLAASGLHWLSA